MKSAEFIKLLEQDGWVLANVRGSHHVFRHPEKNGHISVPHPRKDIGKGLEHKLMKPATIERNE
ncbi:MAG: type II toxin-antitoxin system HicA family toxin [Acidobacteriota bacterium]|jgi:predicted RNA binding protein YcfA (HicA-like mRNA interferase family)|nr:type II toxin-antitoxin system HicA family toxin [Acidobacteriota bacterium]